MKLANYVSGRWSEGLGSGELLLVDPVTGEELASITSQGFDLEASTEMWCPVVCTVAREGPARARSLLPACVRCCSSPPFCRARTSQLHQAIVGIVR